MKCRKKKEKRRGEDGGAAVSYTHLDVYKRQECVQSDTIKRRSGAEGRDGNKVVRRIG